MPRPDLARWIGERATRAWAIGAGVALLAVPTLFGVFTEWTRWPLWIRIAIVILWVLIAALSVAAAVSRDKRIDDLTATQREQRAQLRTIARQVILESVLRRGVRGIPTTYEFTVYLFDPDTKRLEPIWPSLNPPVAPDPRVFVPGRGATGTAWKQSRLIEVRGDAVADASYDLSADQQEFFKDFRSVAATPIWTDARERLGVLTAIGTVDDHYFGPDGSGQDALRTLADVIGVALTAIPVSTS